MSDPFSDSRLLQPLGGLKKLSELENSPYSTRPETETEPELGVGPERGTGSSSVSVRSDQAMDYRGHSLDRTNDKPFGPEPKPEHGSGPGCVSLKSDWSIDRSFDVEGQQPGSVQRVQQESSEDPGDQSAKLLETHLDAILKLPEQSIVSFMKSQLKKYRVVLGSDYPEGVESEREDEDEDQRENKEAFLKITQYFLRQMEQEDLAVSLQSKLLVGDYQRSLKSNLKKRLQRVFEGIAKAGNPSPLNQVYTELFITEGGTGEVNQENEFRQMEAAARRPDREETTNRHEDIFKAPPGRHGPIRTVLTKGVAGIGKTVLTQKFSLDWAEGKANQEIHFLFPFTFRELNMLKEKKYSLVELVHHYFHQTKEAGIGCFDQVQVVFILDGLDECRLPLDFHNTPVLTDVMESVSVDVLVTNLIRGKLLPSARLWITTRPAAANHIPPGYVSMVTELRGFTDTQKEEYFRRRFTDEEQASKIISHIKTSRSLRIMCHIPVLCWITAGVLEDLLRTKEGAELPKSLTETYIHFLVVQSKVKKVEFNGGTETGLVWSPGSRKMIESLGKLAFEQLQRGNMIFYESDLKDSSIDIRAASVYSGVFTQIFREEKGLSQNKMFCFVHLSIQEFLAALYVHLSFIKSGVNLLAGRQPKTRRCKVSIKKPNLKLLHQSALVQASQSPNEHLDLFLRFLLGFSLQTNQRLLGDLLTQRGSCLGASEATVEYIKERIGDTDSAEKTINLFHCLNELKDHSLEEQIQWYLRSGRLSTEELSPAQWSALGFILLSSEDLDVFDLSKYCPSEEVLFDVDASGQNLLQSSRLRNCNLSEKSCEALASVISSQSSGLTELDLSTNDLKDSGVKLLSAGLLSPHCRLKVLRLSGCLITEEGCSSLASALSSNLSRLTKLDLSYNHPGHTGVALLSAQLDHPHVLRAEPAGVRWLRSGLRKYSCDLTVDPNTVNRILRLSGNSRKVTRVEEDQSYPNHPDRFEEVPQLLCRNVLTSRCYWEVQWRGDVHLSVCYRRIRRTGDRDGLFGWNDHSWSLLCCDDGDSAGFYVRHNNRPTSITYRSDSHRVGVYVDYPAGILSFYSITSDGLIHIHTFNTTFTEPLHPGFGLWSEPGSSVSLCSLEEGQSPT